MSLIEKSLRWTTHFNIGATLALLAWMFGPFAR